MNLKTIETVLLFGKSRAFSEEEFLSQLKHHKIELVREYRDGISCVVDGRMMRPDEQNTSDALYERKGIKAVSIDTLERALAMYMDEGTLLMSLKLSRDKERLKNFIQNALLPDTLFFKLIKMYSWGGEDFFENDENRDVSAAFISRFYKNIERNHNVQYATTGFIHLVGQTKSSELLEVIASLEPLQYHPKIVAAIVRSEACNAKMQEQFARKNEQEIDEALSSNPNLILPLIKEFLPREDLAQSMAQNLLLSEETFRVLFAYKVDLALNESLSEAMQNELLCCEDIEVYRAVASNNNLHLSVMQKLLLLEDSIVLENLYKNSVLPLENLHKAYREGEYLSSLAQNEATPVEILYQLQLDSRYERYVKTNATFGKYIQSENIGWLV
jgi:hypothetical protein